MRFAAALSLILFLACSSTPDKFVFPAAAGDWSLDALADSSAAGPGGQQAVYRDSNATVLTVRVEQMGPAEAFERVQKSRPEPGLLYFHHQSYFITVRGDGVANDRMNEFAAALEKQLSTR
ncbi:MAG: hypothetical protein R2762_13745 [Bryobacteraceae bacterium]